MMKLLACIQPLKLSSNAGTIPTGSVHAGRISFRIHPSHSILTSQSDQTPSMERILSNISKEFRSIPSYSNLSVVQCTARFKASWTGMVWLSVTSHIVWVQLLQFLRTVGLKRYHRVSIGLRFCNGIRFFLRYETWRV